MQESDFKLLDIMGEGSAALTYEAENAAGELVCIKRFKTGLEKKDQKELLREISMLQTLRHPRIPKFYGSYVQEVEGRELVHLVMEKIEGQNLREWLKLNRPHQTEVLEILLSLLDILVYLHEIQPPVIHRDIKTSNVIRSSDGSIFLIDFGQATDAIDKTYGHTLVTGTLGYQAPEQIIGQPTVKSDVYSLGAIAVELLTGINPHEMLEGQRLRWERKCSHLSRSLFDWLDKMLEPSEQNRFSATEAKRVLYQLLLVLKKENRQEVFTPQTQNNFEDLLSEAVQEHSENPSIQDEEENEWSSETKTLLRDMIEAFDKMVGLVSEGKLKTKKGLNVFHQSFQSRASKEHHPDIQMLLEFAQNNKDSDRYQDWLGRRKWREGSLLEIEGLFYEQEMAVKELAFQLENLRWWEVLFKKGGLKDQLSKAKQSVEETQEKLAQIDENIARFSAVIGKKKRRKKIKIPYGELWDIYSGEKKLELQMVRIVKGSFIMGALRGDKKAKKDEFPRHKVTLTRNFYLSKYPITQHIWNTVMGEEKWKGGDNHALSDLSWFDCLRFCNRLSEKEGRKPAYTVNGKTDLSEFNSIAGIMMARREMEIICDWDADGYRLPTEAEWEYAARGGEYRLYSGSNDIDKVGWVEENNDFDFHRGCPAGLKKPNSWGLHDMSGGVWEWCWDVYSEYTIPHKTNPTGDEEKKEWYDRDDRVLRGGYFDAPEENARISNREKKSFSHPGMMSRSGFRVARF